MCEAKAMGIFTRASRRTIAVLVAICFSFTLTVSWFASKSSRNQKDETICKFGFCLAAMVVPSAFDALPEPMQTFVISKYSVESFSRYTFVKDGKGQLFAEVDAKRYEDQFLPFGMLFNRIEKDGLGFERLSTVLFEADYLQSKYADSRTTSACDLSTTGRMFGLSEKELRRCIRSAYLLEFVPEFNERTQKLFNSVVVKYANGTSGPLTLKLDGLTDADRKMVLREVAKIDSKARSLGGFR